MRFANQSTTTLELIEGDIREAADSFLMIGRDPVLANHFARRTGRPFSRELSFLRDMPIQATRSEDRRLTVLRMTFRPRGPARKTSGTLDRLLSRMSYPIARTLSYCGPETIALAPFSCRNPSVIALAMIRLVWDLSLASFFNFKSPLQPCRPTHFTIYSKTGVTPFLDALDDNRYSILDNAWLSFDGIQGFLANRDRFAAAQRFRFVRQESADRR